MNSLSVRSWPVRPLAMLRKLLTVLTESSQPPMAVTTCSQRSGVGELELQSLTASWTERLLKMERGVIEGWVYDFVGAERAVAVKARIAVIVEAFMLIMN